LPIFVQKSFAKRKQNGYIFTIMLQMIWLWSIKQNFPMLHINVFPTIYNLAVCSLGTLNPSEQFSICSTIWTNLCVRFIKAKLTKISFIRTLFKTLCIQNFGLFTLFRSWRSRNEDTDTQFDQIYKNSNEK
jgi:hypothetical protein